jgi:hypothetical protein
MTLRRLLEDEATELPGIASASGTDGSIEWRRADRPFATATADGAVAEFALDPAVAYAATRTPDVTPSPRGSGWVRFAPSVLDDHAADRAVAWLASAYRRLERAD